MILSVLGMSTAGYPERSDRKTALHYIRPAPPGSAAVGIRFAL